MKVKFTWSRQSTRYHIYQYTHDEGKTYFNLYLPKIEFKGVNPPRELEAEFDINSGEKNA